MKLSLVFELLLIFVLLAFAASKSVKHRKNNKKGLQKDTETEIGPIENSSINKYCKCVDAFCNCCRDFALPLVNLNGPGCATLTYLSGDKMAVSLSFGNKVITNRTLSSKKPSPVCMPLPGGISKFCGRVYNIARTGEDFRACLGLELQSKSTVEAAVRVSCFKFGSKGVTSEPADPLPLIPDEKGEDDDDDDEDDDYGLGADDDDDDDDDDEDESGLAAVGDVESADYTGFSLLGEDLLGDLFGSSGGKKPNKNKKKQAPLPTSTRRPRPTRRSTRRPNTRITTPRPTRTTTVRVRPAHNRRPTRRTTTRKPTTASIEEISSSILTTASTTAAPLVIPVTTASKIETEKDNQITSVSEETFEPIVAHRVQSTTAKSVTNFDDPGLEMSLAHITGQLSSMPIIPLNSNNDKASSKVEKEMAYEKVEMITPKPFVATANHNVSDDMVQIVQSLDSTEETVHDKETLSPDESRGYSFHYGSIRGGTYEGLTLPRKNQNDDFQLEDLDVLDLANIGETIGDQLGIFGGKKRQNRHTKEKEPDYSDYHAVVDTMEDALLMARNHNGNKNKKDRRRQNKMMRGEWSQV